MAKTTRSIPSKKKTTARKPKMESDNSVKRVSRSNGNSLLGKIGTWNVQTILQKEKVESVRQERK